MVKALSSNQLTRMRNELEVLLPDTAIMEEPVNSSAGGGFTTSTWTPVTDGTVACSLHPLTSGSRGQDVVMASQEQIEVMYQLTIPYDAPLKADYRVNVGSNYYQVLRFEGEHSWRTDKRAIVTEWRDDS